MYRLRHLGVKLEREVVRHNRVQGQLAFDVRLWAEKPRYRVYRAALLGADGITYAIPLLDQARLIALRGNGLLLSGIELIVRNPRASKNTRVARFPQSWWCVPSVLDKPPAESSPRVSRALASMFSDDPEDWG